MIVALLEAFVAAAVRRAMWRGAQLDYRRAAKLPSFTQIRD